LRVGELRFVELDVVALLENGEEFHAVERGHPRQGVSGGQRRGELSRVARCGNGTQGRGDDIAWEGPKKFGGAGGENGEARFAGRGAGEVGLRPEEPETDALVFSKGGVGGVNGSTGGAAGGIERFRFHRWP